MRDQLLIRLRKKNRKTDAEVTYLANDDDLVTLAAPARLVDDVEVVDRHGGFECA